MREIEPSAEFRTLLGRFKSMIGIVDYVLIDPEGTDLDEIEMHKQAAVMLVESVFRRRGKFQREELQRRGLPVPEFVWGFFDYYIDGYRAIGTPISIAKFLGRE